MQISYKPNLKILAIVLNILLIFLCVGFFVAQGMPLSLLLLVSAMLWFLASLVNIFYIFKNKKTRQIQ